MTEKLLESVSDAGEGLSIGLTKLWELVAARQLATVKIGRRTLVVVESRHKYVERLRREAGHQPNPTSDTGKEAVA